MSRKLIVALAAAGLLLAPAAHAADGPDAFQVRSNAGAELRSDKRIAAPVLRTLAKGDGKLKNLGCAGEGDDRWCRIDADGVIGWVAARQLVDYAAPAAPSFSCAATRSAAETLVCKDPDLMSLDTWLASVLGEVQRTAPANAAAARLAAEQADWAKERDACGTAAGEARACIADAYRHRIAELRTRWQLAAPEQTVRFTCDDNSEAVATFYNADPLPSARIEIGDATEVFVGTRGTGETRYDGSFGRMLRIAGKSAQLIWDPAKPALACIARKAP
jgi:uncharacterized protein